MYQNNTEIHTRLYFNDYFHRVNWLIVDDNKIACTTLKQLAGQVKDISIAGECENAMEVYNLLQEHPIDLLLLDIEMPGMTGLELKGLGKKSPVIIFTASKKEYAAQAFELRGGLYCKTGYAGPLFAGD